MLSAHTKKKKKSFPHQRYCTECVHLLGRKHYSFELPNCHLHSPSHSDHFHGLRVNPKSAKHTVPDTYSTIIIFI
jgi:hypothetical protein